MNKSTSLKKNGLMFFFIHSFNFSFDFRTFYPDGLFGYLVNKDKSFYFGIQLQNRRLEVVYKYDDIRYTIMFTKALNDGNWHSVSFISIS